jgi:hypothetical protein
VSAHKKHTLKHNTSAAEIRAAAMITGSAKVKAGNPHRCFSYENVSGRKFPSGVVPKEMR